MEDKSTFQGTALLFTALVAVVALLFDSPLTIYEGASLYLLALVTVYVYEIGVRLNA